MNKREFLSKLEEALVYELPPRAVDENLRYYSSYIDSEVKSGRSVEEVLEELGDPRLIARTIIDAVSSGADGIPGTADDVVYRETPDSDDSGYGAYGGRASDHGSSDNGGFRGSVEINSHTYSGCMPCLIGYGGFWERQVTTDDIFFCIGYTRLGFLLQKNAGAF